MEKLWRCAPTLVEPYLSINQRQSVSIIIIQHQSEYIYLLQIVSCCQSKNHQAWKQRSAVKTTIRTVSISINQWKYAKLKLKLKVRRRRLTKEGSAGLLNCWREWKPIGVSLRIHCLEEKRKGKAEWKSNIRAPWRIELLSELIKVSGKCIVRSFQLFSAEDAQCIPHQHLLCCF